MLGLSCFKVRVPAGNLILPLNISLHHFALNVLHAETATAQISAASKFTLTDIVTLQKYQRIANPDLHSYYAHGALKK